ncbi:PKD domain-containing protein [Pseudoalteromonas prydzensis]|uniref:PKD domain-containing protein n=1 Tax=Pseudoalteromonas prydzensis TaxID=182141 RepID=UPI0007E4E2BC|nr:hypothetical protein [Pseudoalteromonas prydzensis]MBE0380255.1 hypothetical protein [Pseudoalteromonas prydzensis ACAM 620]
MKRKFKYLLSAALIVQSIQSYASWGDSDPYLAVGTSISSPNLAIDSQGNMIIGYANSEKKNDLEIRKISREGDLLWNGMPTLIRDRDQSYTVIWSLGIAPDDAIYTIIPDQTTNDFVLSKTASNGEPAWPTSALVTPDDLYDVIYGDLSTGVQGVSYAIGYQDSPSTSVIEFGMYSHSGEELWKDKVTNKAHYISVLDIKMVKDGVILLYQGPRDNDNGFSLFAQKRSYTGDVLWDVKPIIPQEYSIPSRGVTDIKLYDDGDGGVAFAWRQPMNTTADIQLQHIDKKGHLSFKGNGIRVSPSDVATFSDVNTPTLWFQEDHIAIAWISRGLVNQGRNHNYSVFFQKVSLDGKLLLGTEPVSLVNNLDIDLTKDAGYMDGGKLGYYNGQYSILYKRSLLDSGVGADLRRVDFTPQGEVLQDTLFAQLEDGETQSIAAAISPFGETQASFKFFRNPDVNSYVHSLNTDADNYLNSGIVLSEPVTPWVIDEDESLITNVLYTDDVQTSYLVSVDAALDHTVEAQLIPESNKIQLTVHPAENFNGILPLTVTLTDANDSSRVASYDYVVRVNEVADAPSIDVAETTNVGEQQAVNITATVVDPDSAELTFNWQQLSGPAVSFDAHAQALEFTSPSIIEPTTFAFQLTVSDGELNSQAQVNVVVENDKTMMIEGQDIQLVEGEAGIIAAQVVGAKLPLTVQWQQAAGPDLTISDVNELTTSVYAPFVDVADKSTVMLTVTDANGETAEQSFSVYILDNPDLVEDDSNEDEDSGSSGWMFLAMLLAVSVRRSLNWR